MKKQLIFCFVVSVMVSGSIFKGSDGNLIAQVSREVRIVPPTPIPLDPIKGPAEGIFASEIRDGLKRFLLVDFFTTHGQYDQAVEIVDYTKPVTILGKELAVEKDSELIQLLKYQRQKIEKLQTRPTPRAMPVQENLKQQADALYEKALTYQKFEKYDQATQALQEALELYQKLQIVKKYEEMQKLLKELEGKTTTN